MTKLCKQLQNHSSEYKNFYKKEATKQKKLKQLIYIGKQITVFSRKKKFPPDHLSAKKLTYHTLEMTAIDLQLLSL